MTKKYIVRYEVIEKEGGWGKTVDKENWKLYDEDGSAPNQDGYSSDDFEEETWAKIERAAFNQVLAPDGGIEWDDMRLGWDESIIGVNL